MMRKRILVTGGQAFLGHAYVKDFLITGMTFCVLTTSTRGVRPISPENNGCVVSKEEY